MSNKKATKRALLTSITALAMCVVMLVGTTFAWFTDTATANVNKIQAGKLDVALEMFDTAQNKWVTAEGQTLNFVKAAGGESQAILWEPGAEYKLPKLRVVNNGNLNIKYKVEVTGIQMNRQPVAGVFDLNDVITWKADGLTLGTEATLNPTESKAFTISGKMDTAAGNDYQGLTINGVSITVYATQATGEYDSTRNDYDTSAGYSVVVLPETANAAMSKDTTESKYEYEAADGTVKAEIPTNAVAANETPTVSIRPVADAATGKFVVDAGNGTEKVAYEISISNIAAGSTELAKVSFKLGAGLTNVALKHENLVMTSKSSEADLTTADTFYYDAATGMVTIAVDHFSVFSVTYAAPVATIGSTTYTSLADAFAVAKDGDTIMLLKNTNGNGIKVLPNTFANNGLTVDFNGYVYTVGGVLVGSATTGTNAFQLNQGNKITFKNGSIVGVAEGTKPAEDTPDWRGAPAIVLQNYCDLTLDNMIVTGGDETVYTMSNNCGNIVINNTTINAGKAQGYGSGPFAFDVYGGWYKDNVTVTVKGNSVINGDIELDRNTKNPSTSINTLILGDCTINGNILKSDGTLNFAGNVTLNGNVNVTKNKDDAANRIIVTGATTLNLNGKIITPNDMGNNDTNFTALIVDADTTINADMNGGIDTQENGGYGINVRNGAKLTINGGTYYGGGTAVQAQKGFVIINDGNFAVEPYSNPVYGYKFMLNCIDAAYKAGEAGFTVYGGTYTGFDPSNSDSENPRASFVPEGYTCTKTGEDVWTVTKNA